QPVSGDPVRRGSSRSGDDHVRSGCRRLRFARGVLRAVVDSDVRVYLFGDAGRPRDRAGRRQRRARRVDVLSVRPRLRTSRRRDVIETLCTRFGIEGRLRDAALRASKRTETIAYEAQRDVAANVLEAFAREGIVESDLHGSTGYGYDDPARARYESLLARIFGAERALARLSIVSGTHAIVTALAACAAPG